MSKKANPAVIGGFVVGAIALFATAVALFGGKELFVERDEYVAYFEEGTKGLRVGANVLMNGVRVGYVNDIALLVDAQSLNTLTRVRLELLPDTYIQTIEGVPVAEGMRFEIGHDWLIYRAGLRAQLGIESYITGQLVIELAFRPESTANLRGVSEETPEIPTIPSNLQQMIANIERWVSEVQSDVDIGEIADRVESILRGIDELVHSGDLRTAIAGLSELLNDEDLQGLAAALGATVSDLQATLDETRRFVRGAEDDLHMLVQDLRPVVGQLAAAITEAGQLLAAARGQIDGSSPQVYQLEATLRELEGAAIAIREFFDYLERNPESLIRGKQQ
ncbi:MAG: MlaD family protein [Gammaproteobacteria bacterium]|nr:MlaD family protein [Gammaproteobacteria bacterium]